MRLISATAFLAILAAAPLALAKLAPLHVSVEGMASSQPVPAKFAACIATADGKSGPGENLRPTIRWSGAPTATQSFAVFMMDPDVPADFSDAGKDGKTIAASAKRRDFFHYALINVPASTTELPGGNASDAPDIGTELANDMGPYVPRPGQFGGPCPPWNDARIHHYHFRVLALSKPSVTLPEGTTAAQAWAKLSPQALATGEVTGTYSLNAALAK